MAVFADLPVELLRIILMISCEWPCEKRWLAALPRTCKLVHAITTPLLYDSVSITSSNVLSIFAMCGVDPALAQRSHSAPRFELFSRTIQLASSFLAGVIGDSKADMSPAGFQLREDTTPFRYTTRLHVESWDPRLDTLTWSFRSLVAFAGSQRQIEEMSTSPFFTPSTLVITAQYSHTILADMLLLPSMRCVTHLHMCVAGWRPQGSDWREHSVDLSPAQFTHVTLDYHNDNEWGENIVVVAGHFLAIPSLRRLLIHLRPSPWRSHPWERMIQPLTNFAMRSGEARIHIARIPSGSDGYRETCPCHAEGRTDIFDRSKWLGGEPLLM
ncbi:hypothetical protein EXIGLDRAFT_833611 [Exidia glandulosa HHB12029]|uniref:Uncharacterized protein n=1 Tax=Exidia glandulosa HHB12029 TaxID=1314781 RepID=A0A165KL63_EXIGL|nr:hypothetical protein EXIGLDRAFT_833611 [Exidia glandulosa HHB12029]